MGRAHCQEQMARELLLLESSDWQFLITTAAARDYAEKRFHGHLHEFGELEMLWAEFPRQLRALRRMAQEYRSQRSRRARLPLRGDLTPDYGRNGRESRLNKRKRPHPESGAATYLHSHQPQSTVRAIVPVSMTFPVDASVPLTVNGVTTGRGPGITVVVISNLRHHSRPQPLQPGKPEGKAVDLHPRRRAGIPKKRMHANAAPPAAVYQCCFLRINQKTRLTTLSSQGSQSWSSPQSSR